MTQAAAAQVENCTNVTQAAETPGLQSTVWVKLLQPGSHMQPEHRSLGHTAVQVFQQSGYVHRGCCTV